MEEHYLVSKLRVPLIIAGYLKARAGTRRGDLVSTIDLAPTLLDLIGVKELQHFQGRPIFRGEGVGDRMAISESIRWGNEIRAVREGQYKLIHYLEGDIRHFFDLQERPI